jgi:hypothetical protein
METVFRFLMLRPAEQPPVPPRMRLTPEAAAGLSAQTLDTLASVGSDTNRIVLTPAVTALSERLQIVTTEQLQAGATTRSVRVGNRLRPRTPASPRSGSATCWW